MSGVTKWFSVTKGEKLSSELSSLFRLNRMEESVLPRLCCSGRPQRLRDLPEAESAPALAVSTQAHSTEGLLCYRRWCGTTIWEPLNRY